VEAGGSEQGSPPAPPADPPASDNLQPAESLQIGQPGAALSDVPPPAAGSDNLSGGWSDNLTGGPIISGWHAEAWSDNLPFSSDNNRPPADPASSELSDYSLSKAARGPCRVRAGTPRQHREGARTPQERSYTLSDPLSDGLLDPFRWTIIGGFGSCSVSPADYKG